jgi:HlyD family secretion protein
MAQTARSFTRKHRIGLLALGILIVIVLVAALPSQRRGAIPVRVGKVERGDIQASISTNGKIEGLQNFEAHAPAPAIVKAVLAKEGDHVQAGQLLVQLDDAEARAAAARALAQLRAAEADFTAVQKGGTREEVLTTQSQLQKAQTELQTAQRNLDALQRLQKQGAAAPAEVEAAQARLNAAQADFNLLKQKQQQRFAPQDLAKVNAQVEDAKAAYAAAEALLQRSEIRAPRAGEVYSLPVKSGTFVNSGDLLVQVADLHTVLVRAFVDEPDIGRLSKSERVEVTWDAIPGRTWEGTVAAVPTTVTMRQTRTVGEITASVNNQDLKLLPNVNVSVTVITAEHKGALTLPREAVHQDEGETFVYQIVNGEIKKTDVQTAISNLTEIEITRGVTEGDTVALGSSNGQALRPGQPIRVATP